MSSMESVFYVIMCWSSICLHTTQIGNALLISDAYAPSKQKTNFKISKFRKNIHMYISIFYVLTHSFV
jgi:hypothetical protein